MGRPRRVRVSRRNRAAALPAHSQAEAVAPTTPSGAPADPPPVAAPATGGEPALAAQLAELTAGLLFLSESEAPFTVVALPAPAVLPDVLRELAHLPADAPAEEWTPSDLLRPLAAPDQPDAPRVQALLTFLETRLARTVAYKLGSGRRAVFFIGRTADKTWLGVQTEAVET